MTTSAPDSGIRRGTSSRTGSPVFACSSGMTAMATTCLSLHESGDHVVASREFTAGHGSSSRDLLSDSLGVSVEYVDATEMDAVAAAVTDETALVWMESPTNPLLRLCDLPAIADVAAAADATFVVDNTFSTPYLQRPLEDGADVVVHSTTKYLNGHSDSMGARSDKRRRDRRRRFAHSGVRTRRNARTVRLLPHPSRSQDASTSDGSA